MYKEEMTKEAFKRVEQTLDAYGEQNPKVKKDIDFLKSQNYGVVSIREGKQRVNFGYCKYDLKILNPSQAMYVSEIVYNKKLLELKYKDLFLNTLVHEILHSIAQNFQPSCGHRGVWKELAQTYNNIYKDSLPIQRLSDWTEEGDEPVVTTEYRYEIVCPECGTIGKYKRKGKNIKLIEKGNGEVRCKKCKNINLQVITHW